ncbi:MAG: hypothetical protein JXR97_04190 [Planctomycetes bacterium]|nr:hypothetical protein [Planctomycetota bacterium]
MRVCSLIFLVLCLSLCAQAADKSKPELITFIPLDKLMETVGISVDGKHVGRVGLVVDNKLSGEGQISQIGIAVCQTEQIADSMIDAELSHFEMGVPESVTEEKFGDRSIASKNVCFMRHRNVFVFMNWKGHPPMERIKALDAFLFKASGKVKYGCFDATPAFKNIPDSLKIKRNEKQRIVLETTGLGESKPLVAVETAGAVSGLVTEKGEIEISLDSTSVADGAMGFTVCAVGEGLVFIKQDVAVELEK